MTYKWIFEILKIQMLERSFSAVKRIGQRFVIEGTLNRKVGYSHPRAHTKKHNHRLKITVLKGIRKGLLSTAKIKIFLD